MRNLYAIALGSNRRHGRHGRPEAVVAAALAALTTAGVNIEAASPIVSSVPLGPGGRRFANAAMLVTTALDPPALLAVLKRIERDFGRRPGRRWGPRVLDLDILLWAGGAWRSRALDIPHPRLGERAFVLDPLAAIAGDFRLPGSALAVRHLAARFARRAPVDRRSPAP